MRSGQDFVHVSVDIFQSEVDQGVHLEERGRDEDGDDVLGLEVGSLGYVTVRIGVQVP